jgi:acetate---CoA ligase (ADP-forming)
MNNLKSALQGFDALFKPRSIAVIGASSDPTKTGGRPVYLLQKHGYGGAIYPVNPKADAIQGLPAFPSIDDLPSTPDLILVAVPGAAALRVLERAATLGVGAAIVLSAGFAESGPDGQKLQDAVTVLAERTGMRILGPNCLGSVSVKERAIGTFSVALEKAMPLEGGVSIVSQSGNIGSAAMRMLGDCGAGVARFVATGNEADIQAGDAIAWLADDPDTKVILCCLETCRDADRLTKALALAKQAKKPVIALKIGTSEAGQKAALSHTGGLAGSDRVFDAVFARYGAVRVRSLEELVQVGAALEALGKRSFGADADTSPSTTVIAASGGFGVMMADAAAAHGVAINPLTSQTQARINSILPLASAANPVDATAQMSANPDILEALVDAALSDPANNSVCIMLALGMEVPRLRSVFTDGLANAARRHPEKVLVACVAGPKDAIRQLGELGIACFPTIDAAMAGIAALARLEKSRLGASGANLASVEQRPLDARAWRNEATAKAALGAAGLVFATEIVATSTQEAVSAAEKIGMPVAMKILSPDIQHKSDIGGVELDISGALEVDAAFKRIMAAAASHAPQAEIDGILISPMAGRGTELILGTITDPIFGPVVMVGLGGIFAEIFQDTALRLAPVGEEEAGEMLRELKAFPLLNGARGRAPADVNAVKAAISALSGFAARHAADVAEIDINPLIARPEGQGAVALDALIIPRHGDPQENLQ